MPNILSAGYAGCCADDIVADFSVDGDEPQNMTLVSGSPQTCSGGALRLNTAGSRYELDETFCTPDMLVNIGFEYADHAGGKRAGLYLFFDDFAYDISQFFDPAGDAISCANNSYPHRSRASIANSGFSQADFAGLYPFNFAFELNFLIRSTYAAVIAGSGPDFALSMMFDRLDVSENVLPMATSSRIGIGLKSETDVDTWVKSLTVSDAHCGCGPVIQGTLAQRFSILHNPSIIAVTIPSMSPESGCSNIDCGCFSGYTFLCRRRSTSTWSLAVDFACADNNTGCSGGASNPNTSRYNCFVTYDGYGHFTIGLIRLAGNFASTGCTAGTSNFAEFAWEATVGTGLDRNSWSAVGTPNYSSGDAPCIETSITIGNG